MNISCDLRLISIICRGKKTLIVAKNRRTILPERNILKSHNMRRTFYRCRKTKKRLKSITGPYTETIMLNNGKI